MAFKIYAKMYMVDEKHNGVGIHLHNKQHKIYKEGAKENQRFSVKLNIPLLKTSILGNLR